MSLHAITHPWEVQDLDDGPLVRLTPRDLDAGTLAVLADELFELFRESGRRHLTLDFAEVGTLSASAVGKLFALDRQLREAGGQLLLCNLDATLRELLQAESWAGTATSDSLSLPAREPAELENCFVVFVREGSGNEDRPEKVERPVASCPSYDEAVRVREQLRQAGKTCIIRFVGQAGGGD